MTETLPQLTVSELERKIGGEVTATIAAGPPGMARLSLTQRYQPHFYVVA